MTLKGDRDTDVRLQAGEADHLPPEERQEAEETPLTRGEVQDLINSLTESLKGLLSNFEEKFTEKTELAFAMHGLLIDLNNRKYISKEAVIREVKKLIPPSLIGLDSDPLRKTGDTLKLESSSAALAASKDDKAFWGPSSEGSVMPDGDEDNPHLVWNPVTEAWEIDVIVPDGTSDTPNLVWNALTEKWEASEIVPNGTADDPHLVWDDVLKKWDIDRILPTGDVDNLHLVWNPVLGLWEKGAILPAGGVRWMVLQRNDDGDAVWDWVRWKL